MNSSAAGAPLAAVVAAAGKHWMAGAVAADGVDGTVIVVVVGEEGQNIVAAVAVVVVAGRELGVWRDGRTTPGREKQAQSGPAQTLATVAAADVAAAVAAGRGWKVTQAFGPHSLTAYATDWHTPVVAAEGVAAAAAAAVAGVVVVAAVAGGAAVGAEEEDSGG